MVDITVAPDPTRPHGGYARLSLPADQLAEAEVSVVVFDVFSGRYLGEDGFQGERTLFGPYPVARDGDTASIVIGPEIVNQLEDVVSLDLEIGAAKGQVSWPDDVIPAVGAARLGGIVTGPVMETSLDDSNLVGQMPTEDADVETALPEGTTEEPPEADEDPGDAVAEPEAASKPKWPLWAGVALVVLALAAGGAWYFAQQNEATEDMAVVEDDDDADEDEDQDLLEDEGSEAIVTTLACAPSDLAALSDLPFAEARAALETCGAEADTQEAFRVLQRAVAAGDPQALLLFGELYDADVTVPVIETDMEITLGDDLATATEYYYRALQGGETGATDRLRDVCQRLAGSTNTLEQAALQEYCP